MDRSEAEAVYDAGRERCVEFILELAQGLERLTAANARLEERVRRLELELRKDSSNSSTPPSRDPVGVENSDLLGGGVAGVVSGTVGARGITGWAAGTADVSLPLDVAVFRCGCAPGSAGRVKRALRRREASWDHAGGACS